MPVINIHITGMTCNGCASHAEATLNALPGVQAQVSYDHAMARVETTGEVDEARLLEAIEASGYHGKLENSDEQPRSGDANSPLHIAIVGTGSASFAAAIKAAEQGARVTLIEAAEVIGGTCVNIGCVPSKILIRGATLVHLQTHHGVEGLPFNTPVIDRGAMVRQQQQWVDKLRHAKYESILDSQPHIELIRGMARFLNRNTLIVTAPDGSEKAVHADRILLATGASAALPKVPGLKNTPYWTSTQALLSERLPQHLIVLGASVVALELAQAFRHLGATVTILARSTLLSRQDEALGEELKNVFEQEGITILSHTRVLKVHHDAGRFVVQTTEGGVEGDQLLVATGRSANTAALDLDKAGVQTEAHGRILVDDHMRTSVEHIYAAGDCTNQPQYVYVAAAAGTRAAINMTGGDATLDLSVLPTVVFTEPQVASVGLSEKQARDQGLDVASRKLDLENVPRALANFDTRGFIKLVAEKHTGHIIGCQILASQAGEIIQSAALAMRHHMTIEELADQLFPYLTMVEGLKLTAQTFSKDVSQLSCCAG